MRVKMTLEDVLQGKNKGSVATADENTSMHDAIKLMASKNFGALIVTSQGKPAGIVTERDVLRQASKFGKDFFDKPLSEVMTRDIVVGQFADDIEVAKRVMTERRFRHMPIMHRGELVGMISIGDLVRSQLTTAEAITTYLHDYIRGAYS